MAQVLFSGTTPNQARTRPGGAHRYGLTSHGLGSGWGPSRAGHPWTEGKDRVGLSELTIHGPGTRLHPSGCSAMSTELARQLHVHADEHVSVSAESACGLASRICSRFCFKMCFGCLLRAPAGGRLANVW